VREYLGAGLEDETGQVNRLIWGLSGWGTGEDFNRDARRELHHGDRSRCGLLRGHAWREEPGESEEGDEPKKWDSHRDSFQTLQGSCR
jgi:hypothetical protein